MDEGFYYMVLKGLKIFFFCFFFLEGSFFVEGGGVGENVKVWSGKKVERYDFWEWKLLGLVLVFVGWV